MKKKGKVVQNTRRRKGDAIEIAGDYQFKALSSSSSVQRFWHTSKQTTIQRVLPPKNKDVILDIGCGSGVISDFLANSGAEVYGIDGSTRAMKFAQKQFKKKNLTFIKALVDEKFSIHKPVDKIYCLELIEHIYFDQGEVLLRESQRLLKKGGEIFITTPNYRSLWPLIEKGLDAFHLVPHLDGDQHVSHYTPDLLRSLLMKTGFEVTYIGTKCGVAPWISGVSWKLAEKIDHLEYSAGSMWGSVLVITAKKTH